MDGKKGEEYRSLSPPSSALHSFGISNIYFVSFRFTPLHISFEYCQMARRRRSRMCSLFCCLYPDLRFGDGERKYIHRGSFLTRESNVKGIRFSIFVSFYETKFYFEAIIGSVVDSFSGRTMKRIFRITSLVFLEN